MLPNNALLGTRHKWRAPRTLTFCFARDMKIKGASATTTVMG